MNDVNTSPKFPDRACYANTYLVFWKINNRCETFLELLLLLLLSFVMLTIEFKFIDMAAMLGSFHIHWVAAGVTILWNTDSYVNCRFMNRVNGKEYVFWFQAKCNNFKFLWYTYNVLLFFGYFRYLESHSQISKMSHLINLSFNSYFIRRYCMADILKVFILYKHIQHDILGYWKIKLKRDSLHARSCNMKNENKFVILLHHIPLLWRDKIVERIEKI